ncbi:hypothetical protein ELE36_02270 [Pseudolysobacter antarcticus]|uniref:Uncharacterized protein n=1 Tax=Pseudolysobacter antarcticus TaxID=2511995 RepID=A0A411HFM3_9GAMM|nr:hypothetical protein [Pseudolysobacter antarcticus]QBB69293.1 hypothetical protein ELE36_02270 [Pseudolysobacter antarcticus]
MFKPFTAVVVILLLIVLLPIGGLLMVPLLLASVALLPLLGLLLGVALLVGILRLAGVVLAGAFTLIFSLLGFTLMLAVGAVLFGLAIGLLHVLLPVLLLAGIVWLISRAARPNEPRALPPAASI